MTAYTAPLQDMRFVLYELAGLDEVASLPDLEEATPEGVDAVLEQAARLASEVLAPLNQSGDRQGARLMEGAVRTPDGWKAAYRTFVEGGWNGLAFTPDYGGQGLPWVVSVAVQEMWHAANMSFGLCPLLNQGAVHALLTHGDQAVKSRFLPKLVSGEWTGTMNLTEPQAGSDLSAVRTRAIPKGEHYLISGQKIFITYGDHDLAENIVHLVLARTPDAPPGLKGLSLFVVPKIQVSAEGSLTEPNDVRCVALEHKMGIHASPTAVLAYGEAGGAVGYLVGEKNQGLKYMFTMMNLARLAVGIEGLAIAERAYQQARAYARERVQGRAVGGTEEQRITIIHHPDVRRMLLTMKAQVEAMRALAYWAAATLDKSHHHPDAAERARYQSLVELLTPLVKGWCTELGVETASLGIQVHGGMGYIEETGASQHLRDARITTIYEGTTGIQANDLVGRKIVRNEGLMVRAFIEDLRALNRELSQASSAPFDYAQGRALGAMSLALTEGINALATATDWILASNAQDPRLPAAASVHYLRLMGTVAGGWQMARAALKAHQKLAAGEDKRRFYAGKIATARFYADQILPQAGALLVAITRGSSAVMALDEDQF
jgi:Acyl-CoA dehydrogenases